MRFNVRERVHQIIAELVNALRKFSSELLDAGGKREFRARMNQIGDGLGLGEVEPAVEECTAGKFAGFGQPRARFPKSRRARAWRAKYRRDR